MKTQRFFYSCRFLIALILCCFASAAFAWQRGVSVGYGSGQDIGHHNYTNSGIFLSSDLTTLWQRSWFHMTINGAIGYWVTTAPINQRLFTAAAALSLRLYPYQTTNWHPYLIASGGPAYISSRDFGEDGQGANVTFQTTAGLGFEWGKDSRWDANIRLVHYSNAYLIQPNDGFNMLYVVSLGCLI